MNSAVSISKKTSSAMRPGSSESPHLQTSSVAPIKPDKDTDEKNGTKIFSVSWNWGCQCFTVNTSNGFRTYNSEPFQETSRSYFKGKDFAIVEMLQSKNTTALVGVLANPEGAQNRVTFWDDFECTWELVVRSEVKAVKLMDQRLVVVQEQRVCLYNIGSQKPFRQIETYNNPKGLCSVSFTSYAFTMACLALNKGRIRVEHFDVKDTTFIGAHDSDIACINLTLDGLLLATASTKGTLIRLFNTKDGTCLQELRRGTDRAEIYSIAFSPTAKWLAITSDKGTVHIFNLNVQEVCEDASRKCSLILSSEIASENPSASVDDAPVSKKSWSNISSPLSFIKGILPKYFSSERSFSQFHLPEVKQSIAAFGSCNTLLIVSMDGSFRRCSFDPVNGGKMVEEEYFNFMNDIDIGQILPPDEVVCGY